METRIPHDKDDRIAAAPQPPSEEAVRLMLQASREDIAAGRVTPLATVTARLRASAQQVRTEHAETSRALLRTAP